MTTVTTTRPLTAITEPSVTRSAVRDAVVISQRNLRRIVRTPQLLMLSSLLPILFTLLFRYVFGGAIHPPGQTYIDYLIPTMLILSTLFGATTATAMAVDMSSGMLDRFRSLPIARSAVLAGRTIADLVRASLVALLVLIVGTALGFRFHNGALLGLAGIGVVLAFTFAMSWQMAWIGMKTRDAETAPLAAFLPIFLLVFASSGFVPVNTMPGWLQAFAHVQPLTVTINLVRALTQGGPIYHWLWQTAAWTAGILIVFSYLCVAEYRKV